MLTDIVGYSLSRTIPAQYLFNIMTGVYKIYGGVIRDGSGRIVAHFVNKINPLDGLFSPINTAISTFNTYQLYQVGGKVYDISESTKKIESATSHIINL